MSPRSILTLIGIGLAIVIAFAFLGNTLTWNNQGEVLYMQYPSGKQTVVTKPGPVLKWFATTEKYRQVVTIAIGHPKETGSAQIEPFIVQFNDFAKARMTGIVRVEIPSSSAQIQEIRRQYAGGYQHFVTNAIIPVVKNAFTLSANLRGAQDAAQTLAFLQQDIMDQLQNGTFITKSVESVDTTWEMIGAERTPKFEKRLKNEIRLDSTGLPKRTHHILMDLGCRITSCQIDPPDFDEATEKTIQMRREAALATEVAKQQAIKATQDAVTAEANGRAAAMTAKWVKEKEKAEAVTEAEKTRDVAKLAKEAAEFEKQAVILKGQGEAEAKKLAMVADGALNQKLETYAHVQEVWANAFAQGFKVPTVEMGGGAGSAINSWDAAMRTITMKQLSDLGLDMNIQR
jgi:hypothetical protein